MTYKNSLMTLKRMTKNKYTLNFNEHLFSSIILRLIKMCDFIDYNMLFILRVISFKHAINVC